MTVASVHMLTIIHLDGYPFFRLNRAGLTIYEIDIFALLIDV